MTNRPQFPVREGFECGMIHLSDPPGEDFSLGVALRVR